MKKSSLIAVVILFFLAGLFSLLAAFKSGASFMYYKLPLNPAAFQAEQGFAYRYKVNLPPLIFPPADVLLLEEGRQLTRAAGQAVIEGGNGVFTTEKSEDGGFYLYMAPTGNEKPASNGRTYLLYCGLSLLSPVMGIVYLAMVLFACIRFLRFGLRPANRAGFSSLAGSARVLEAFLLNARAGVVEFFQSSAGSWRGLIAAGGKLAMLAVFSAFGLVLQEWLFQVTKSSFMNGISFGEKLAVLLVSTLAAALPTAAAIAVLAALAVLLRLVRLAWLPALAAAALPALLAGIMAGLWLDHFTYTLFGFGILTASGPMRTLWGAGILLITLSFFFGILRFPGIFNRRPQAPTARLFQYTALAVLVISATAAAAFTIKLPSRDKTASGGAVTASPDRPNIILIGSDGLSARNMSVYGYTRETTPRMDILAKESLVAENAFTNSGYSYGSVGSILTSKMPSDTHLFYPPDMLKGKDRFDHLPELLKDMGYTTYQLAVPYYVDSYTMNFMDGFDQANGQTHSDDPFLQALHALDYDLPAYLIQMITVSLIDRGSHAFFIKNVENPFDRVTRAVNQAEDLEKITSTTALLRDQTNPVFVHLHLLGTHGETFDPAVRQFSAGEDQTDWWMTDFYDDAILSFDGYIGTLLDTLEQDGELDSTMIIIYSDHAMNWGMNERIPLIFHFPGGAYQGRVTANAQNLDIAPTILDYLGVPVPAWMQGSSLLQPLPQDRLIFSLASDINPETLASLATAREAAVDPTAVSIPLLIVQVVDCQRWYQYHIDTSSWTFGDILQHTAPCHEGSLLGQDELTRQVTAFLGR